MEMIEVVAGVIWKNGRYLAARRYGCKFGSGFWEFPGGKIEQGESKEEALARELKEELGIVVQDFQFWKSEEHIYSNYTVILHFFHVSGYLNAPILVEGHDALAWIRPEESGELQFLPADARVLEALKSDYSTGFHS